MSRSQLFCGNINYLNHSEEIRSYLLVFFLTSLDPSPTFSPAPRARSVTVMALLYPRLPSNKPGKSPRWWSPRGPRPTGQLDVRGRRGSRSRQLPRTRAPPPPQGLFGRRGASLPQSCFDCSHPLSRDPPGVLDSGCRFSRLETWREGASASQILQVVVRTDGQTGLNPFTPHS